MWCGGVVQRNTYVKFINEMHSLEDMDLGIRVLMEIIWWMQIPDVLKFMKKRGYDVKPKDHVRVTCGLHYKATGIVLQCIDFPNAHLTLTCNSGNALVSMILLMLLHDNSIL